MANLLQRYLGNYVRGLNKEALKISVWQGSSSFFAASSSSSSFLILSSFLVESVFLMLLVLCF